VSTSVPVEVVRTQETSAPTGVALSVSFTNISKGKGANAKSFADNMPTDYTSPSLSQSSNRAAVGSGGNYASRYTIGHAIQGSNGRHSATQRIADLQPTELTTARAYSMGPETVSNNSLHCCILIYNQLTFSVYNVCQCHISYLSL
jgi:hypothetical protein